MTERILANGRFIALIFYLLACAVAVFSGGMNPDIPLYADLLMAAFLVFTVAGLLTAKPGAGRTMRRYEILQSTCFVMVSLMLCYVYNSTSVLLFVFCVQSFLMMVFLDEQIYLFQGMVMTVVFAAVCVFHYYGGEPEVRTEHYFGAICVLAAQWVCIQMVRLFNSQTRHMLEQEQSLDDMLRILEVKCLEARQAVQSKSDFLSNMSHEIRTPINSVLGMNEMILRESSDEDILEYASNIDSSGRMLLSLVNDVLDFSKIDSGNMEITPVVYQTAEFVSQILRMIWVPANERGIGLVIEIDNNLPSELYGDDVRFRQVLTNLLTNAVKYTEEGTVTLRIEAEYVSDFHVILHCEVRDTGIGIKEEQMPELFTAFKRLDEKKNRGIIGTGLGLPITYHILESMGSHLQVESVYGVGSIFSFRLPQEVVDETPVGDLKKVLKSQAAVQGHHGKLYAPKAKILVVDDNEMNRRVFINLLKESEIQIDQAESGKRCLELTGKKSYDMIFLDHMMPQMDGIETLERMRQADPEGMRKTPVIALTANAVSGAREMYLNAGFTEFLSKPVMPDRLERVLADYLPQDMVQEKPCEEPRKTGENTADTGKMEEEELPVIDGIDWNFAGIHFPDQKMLLHTLEDFYKMIMYEAEKLENFYEHITEEGQIEEFQIQVHGMKSAAALVGIIPLAGCAKMLEDAARNKDLERIWQMTPPFLKEWRDFRQRLSMFAGEEEEEENKKEDDSELLALMGMLQGAADSMDLDTMDEIVLKLPEYKLPEGCREAREQLEIAVTNLDTDAILALTEEMMNKIRENKEDRR